MLSASLSARALARVNPMRAKCSLMLGWTLCGCCARGRHFALDVEKADFEQLLAVGTLGEGGRLYAHPLLAARPGHAHPPPARHRGGSQPDLVSRGLGETAQARVEH